MWSENVRTVRDFFQMYMRPKAEQYFRGEMFVNLKISTITGGGRLVNVFVGSVHVHTGTFIYTLSVHCTVHGI